MSECKFRGKRIDNGEWVYGNLIEWQCWINNEWIFHKAILNGMVCNRKPLPTDFIEVAPETVGQFIQTVNDFEIYVGDTVKAYKYGDKETTPFIENIEYRNGTYMFGNWTWLEFLDKFCYAEVIGNIYEVSPCKQ